MSVKVPSSVILVRNSRGYSLAELGPAIFIFFIVFMFPMLDMSTAYLKAVYLTQVARDAARVGAKNTPVSVALTMANTQGQNEINNWCGTGVSNWSVTSYIAWRPNPNDLASSGSTSGRQTTPLSSGSVSTSNYVYFIQTEVIGDAQPMFPVKFFANVPGLSTPVHVDTTGESYFENQNGTALIN